MRPRIAFEFPLKSQKLFVIHTYMHVRTRRNVMFHHIIYNMGVAALSSLDSEW